MTKNWIFSDPPPPEFIQESAAESVPAIAARLLWTRGLKTKPAIDAFLNPNYEQGVPDPFLFKDMPQAVDLILTCLKNNAKIVVHGDYDADGVDAAAILVLTLRKLGGQNIEVFIPHRETDGYGLNEKTIKYLHERGAKLIITCDCGISNTKEIALARKLGIKTIVTDHHAMPPKLPEADAILHPLIPGETYPDKTLSGGGVAFKLAQALLKNNALTNQTLPDGAAHEAFAKWLLDLVAISSVADMVPLLGETRVLVKYGLMVLNKTRNLGLRALIDISRLNGEDGKLKKNITTETISFQLAPRINAAGRMDHANVAFALLIAETEAEAKELAAQLQQNNLDRQKLTEKLTLAARYQVVATQQENNPLIFVLGEGWPTGILGLIAGRVREEFGRPAIVMGQNAAGEITGSGRSHPAFNMIEAIKTIPECFNKFGGHPQACGFSLKNGETLEDFKSKLLPLAAAALKNTDLEPEVKVDAVIDLDDITWPLYETLQKFAPFGVSNPEPIYAAQNLTLVAMNPVGNDGKHLRLLVKHNSHLIKKTIAFGFGNAERHPADWKQNLKPGDKIDLAFTIDVNEWNGRRELQLAVKDIRRSL
ncbi:MAG: single-stranded-DNA-specific exonuclease RecJ [Candidatus Magasanikbacteria bacterium]|nr:single-stranded-DNA-specific exonuclease RecJ [Candidatus Magasanikbacteria bacterium]